MAPPVSFTYFSNLLDEIEEEEDMDDSLDGQTSVEKTVPTRRHICDSCVKVFSRVYHLNRHKEIHTETCFECVHCQKKFNTDNSLYQHLKIHQQDMETNLHCGERLHNIFNQFETKYQNIKKKCNKYWSSLEDHENKLYNRDR
jgi:hypothetical protein